MSKIPLNGNNNKDILFESTSSKIERIYSKEISRSYKQMELRLAMLRRLVVSNELNKNECDRILNFVFKSNLELNDKEDKEPPKFITFFDYKIYKQSHSSWKGLCSASCVPISVIGSIMMYLLQCKKHIKSLPSFNYGTWWDSLYFMER